MENNRFQVLDMVWYYKVLQVYSYQNDLQKPSIPSLDNYSGTPHNSYPRISTTKKFPPFLGSEEDRKFEFHSTYLGGTEPRSDLERRGS